MAFFRWAAPLFGRYADRWDAGDVALISGWLRPFVPPGGHLLDLAGGTGALARKLVAALDCRATVLDATPEMLAYVEDDPRVTPMRGVAEHMPFPSDTFDAVLVSDAFHHFRDQDGAVREMQRVTRCGGGVLVMDLDPRGLMRLIVLGERLLGEPGGFLAPDEMCAFMSARGIDGTCEKTRGVSYRFLGEVRDQTRQR